jgi:nucleoside-diphosphate kinase
VTPPAQAQAFYAVHRERPFYGSLVAFMTEGPVMPVALEREHAVARLREVMGATDVAKAADGTIRKLYGSSIERNAIHGSDSAENARRSAPSSPRRPDRRARIVNPKEPSR